MTKPATRFLALWLAGCLLLPPGPFFATAASPRLSNLFDQQALTLRSTCFYNAFHRLATLTGFTRLKEFLTALVIQKEIYFDGTAAMRLSGFHHHFSLAQSNQQHQNDAPSTSGPVRWPQLRSFAALWHILTHLSAAAEPYTNESIQSLSLNWFSTLTMEQSIKTLREYGLVIARRKVPSSSTEQLLVNRPLLDALNASFVSEDARAQQLKRLTARLDSLVKKDRWPDAMNFLRDLVPLQPLDLKSNEHGIAPIRTHLIRLWVDLIRHVDQLLKLHPPKDERDDIEQTFEKYRQFADEVEKGPASRKRKAVAPDRNQPDSPKENYAITRLALLTLERHDLKQVLGNLSLYTSLTSGSQGRGKLNTTPAQMRRIVGLIYEQALNFSDIADRFGCRSDFVVMLDHDFLRKVALEPIVAQRVLAIQKLIQKRRRVWRAELQGYLQNWAKNPIHEPKVISYYAKCARLIREELANQQASRASGLGKRRVRQAA